MFAMLGTRERNVKLNIAVELKGLLCRSSCFFQRAILIPFLRSSSMSHNLFRSLANLSPVGRVPPHFANTELPLF